MLHALQPTPKLYDLAHTMFKIAWTQRQAQVYCLRGNPEKEAAKIATQVEGLLDRIVDASNASMSAGHETRSAKLEQDKLLITEKLQNRARPRHSFEEFFELALDFLRDPWKLWDSDQLTLKRAALRLGYCRSEGLRPPEIAFAIQAVNGIGDR